jgi:hypothetical protein
MIKNRLLFHSRRSFFLGGTAAALGLASCSGSSEFSGSNAKLAAKPFKMGERTSVGPITYNVLEATYFTQLSEGGKSRLPEKRFLVIRLSITNGSGKEVVLPLFRLIDDQGSELSEMQDASFLPGWLGIIRKIGPTQTEEGRILFDVSPKLYKLELTDGAEAGKEQMAFVEIPIDFDTSEPVNTPDQASPRP